MNTHAGYLLLAVSLGVFPAACGSSDDTIDTFSTGGKDAGLGGSSASSGAGGTGGKGGKGGSGGTAGAGGAVGDASADGQAGAAGGAGASGAGGVAGSGGSATGGSGGTAGSGGSAGSGGGATDAGADAATCPDPTGTEPNGDEDKATSVAGVSDCDEVKSASGVLGFFPDEDWFKFAGTGGLLSCSPNPKVKLDTNKLRVCVFAECTSGTTTLTCAKGTTATSPKGRKGCCGSGDAEAVVSCSGLGAKSSTVYVRVDNPGKSVCTPYKLDYSY